MICILARRGRFLETILQDGAGSGVPRTRREPPRREVRTPTASRSCLARAVAAAPVPLPGAASWVRIRKPPRWSAERGPGRPGTGGRASHARQNLKSACRRSITPHRGDGIAAVATAVGADAPVGPPADAKSEGTCEETQKPGRSNAPRERTTLRCLTS